MLSVDGEKRRKKDCRRIFTRKKDRDELLKIEREGY